MLFRGLQTKCFHYSSIIFSCLVLAACEQSTPPPTPLPQVRVQALSELLEPYVYSVPAKALSLNNSQLSAEISATVAATKVTVGETVELGQALVMLNCDDTENQLAQAKANATSAAARAKLSSQQYNRAKRLRKQRSIAEEDLNLRQSELTAANADQQAQLARLAIAQRDVENCVIRAPFKAVVTAKYAQVGEIANTGTAMLRVVDIDNLEVVASVITDDANSLSNSKNAQFIYKDIAYPLSLNAIANVIDERTRTQEVRFSFTEQKPLPGAAGRLVWQDIRPSLAAHMLSRRQQQLGILIADKQTVKFIALPNTREGQPAFVNSLPADTHVITEGRLGLAVGDKIDIIE